MNSPANRFFDEWSIYEEILAQNYMHHDDIYRRVQAFFAERFDARAIKILDLGCGSARHLAPVLLTCALRGYVGYDLSDAALAQARRNLASLDCPVRLHRGDLLDGLRSQNEHFDLIFTSFALHHLSSAAKFEFFQLAAEKLSESGVILVIDTFRDGDESRELYLDRYCAWLGTRCKTIPAPAQALMFEHVRSCDFPESAEDLKRMAARAGLKSKTKIEHIHWHQIWSFEKAGRLRAKISR